jgi:hypothetical protein
VLIDSILEGLAGIFIQMRLNIMEIVEEVILEASSANVEENTRKIRA